MTSGNFPPTTAETAVDAAAEKGPFEDEQMLSLFPTEERETIKQEREGHHPHPPPLGVLLCPKIPCHKNQGVLKNSVFLGWFPNLPITEAVRPVQGFGQ